MNYYEELGIKKEASVGEVKRAYRQLAKRYHPDRKPGDDQAAKRFVRIVTAYETLMDEDKRKVYDNSLPTKGKSQDSSHPKDFASATQMDPTKMNAFEDFLGFTASGDQVVSKGKQRSGQAQTSPINTHEMFEKFFRR